MRVGGDFGVIGKLKPEGGDRLGAVEGGMSMGDVTVIGVALCSYSKPIVRTERA